MVNLGLSPNAIQSVLQKTDWVNIYKQELSERCSDLNAMGFPEKYFVNAIKPHLEKALQDEISNDSKKDELRKIIQRWMLVSEFKSQSLIRLLLLIPDELSLSNRVKKKYRAVPIGPQDSDVVDQMTPEELQNWHEGSLAIFFAGTSISNLLGLFVSELFFTFEAMARVLCIGICLEFAIKSILPSIIIQHDEIHKTLRRIGNESKQKVSCKMCSLQEICFRSLSYQKISQIYELFYHLRAIKDYRLEFYFEPELTTFLIKDYMPQGFAIACVADEAIDRIFSGYMKSPLLLKDYKDKIHSILSKIRT